MSTNRTRVAKFKVPRSAKLTRFFVHPAGKFFLAFLVTLLILGTMAISYYYVKYSRLIDEKFRSGPFAGTSRVFAAPKTVSVGDRLSIQDLVSHLRRSGYGESRANRLGWYHIRPDAIEIFPGPDSYFDQEECVIAVKDDRIAKIVSARDHTERPQYRLEPELITSLSEGNRQKRRLIRFEDIPRVLVNAVISAEDKRFFQHSGFDPFRIMKAAYVDIKEGRKGQGASTMSMQLARMFWLDTNKHWKRKAAEVLITLQLEQRLSKEEIFELYANQIPLGRRGSFDIHGFGEGAQAYLGKDVRQVTLPEAAMLAGLIQRPSFTNPFRHPERMRERRNVVLLMMRQNDYISETEYRAACAAELSLAPLGIESAGAPYYVDLVNDELQTRFQDHDFHANPFSVYTTLDLNLQRAAAEAVRTGLKGVDEQIKRQRRSREPNFPDVQVALIALDPHTGEVKALIGGRNYGMSQLNHVSARRPPGSVFKPFVYAAALNTAIQGGPRVLTPLTTVMDEPTTFWFDEKPYEPNNYKQEFHGAVTVRQALTKSMNVPAVKVAEMVGYEAVAGLAKDCGLNLNIQPTPAIALGAYEVTPMEIAGAYTVFANQGVWVKPHWVSIVRLQNGKVVYQHAPESKPAVDPRVAYLVVNLMEEVLRSGTGAGVRAKGFAAPAAGKTGTSHDGWFAGFTSELLCIVWVGFDDYRELNLEGASSALPIWTEFMKKAAELREYRNTKPFEAPDGIVSLQVDPTTNQLATPACPATRVEVFIAGSQPVETCRLHGGGEAGSTHVAGWDTGAPVPERPAEELASRSDAPKTAQREAQSPSQKSPAANKAEDKSKDGKKGIFRRLLDVFK